jgi:hypothetical protein
VPIFVLEKCVVIVSSDHPQLAKAATFNNIQFASVRAVMVLSCLFSADIQAEMFVVSSQVPSTALPSLRVYLQQHQIES